ncbi:hypothetical protein G7Z17_g877 [Cylindrodendrum hubeiense]|uniref:Protein NO VEIN C-terminal domain-containing protein n=1 Tax=Cylindrodendrum hubeiense TaxID=595255 RepID=A0A9P5HGY4_9HYPO|nr:hypothetical protein G7Z17_g877 [Cylindrodendrum hubeiense]
MTDPVTQISEKIEEKGLRITSTILNSSRAVIPEILEYEGIALGDFKDDFSEPEDGYQPEQENPGSVTPDDSNAHLLRTQTRTEAEGGRASLLTNSTTSDTTDQSPLRTPTTSQSINHSLTGAQSFTAERQGGPHAESPSERNGGHVSPSPQFWNGADFRADQSQQSYAEYTHARSDFAHRSASRDTSRPILVDSETDRYVKILRRVVRAARAASFPSQGSFDMTGISDALPRIEVENSYDGLEQPPRFRSTSQLERDKKIGAAGELYVFELLKKLALPGFSMANWQSTIRKYVVEHPEYADIVYDDANGAFTKLLVENGYLNREVWDHKKPHYLLEVKSTTGPCNTPFFMSKGQYRRMHTYRESVDTIYIILRVFNVDKDSVRVCLAAPASVAAPTKSNESTDMQGTN